jgi:chromosome segregation ATPase
MNRTINTIVLLTIIAISALVLYYPEKVRLMIGITHPPCSEPITYSLGSFDARFGISNNELLKDTEQATAVWNAAIGKQLFKYDSSSQLKINLIYDYRQKATNQQSKIGNVISSGKTDFNILKAKYDALERQYTIDKSTLQSQISLYDQNLKVYNDQVAYSNSQGGANRDTFNSLQSTKQDLAEQARSIEQTRTSFNQEVNDLNSLAAELNALAKTLNINVKTYNAVSTSVGEQFNEGEYIEDSSGKRINIYEFKDETQLVRVLEHEFGHALNLDHVDSPKAIMYYLNEGTNEKLTADDISALEAICNSK